MIDDYSQDLLRNGIIEAKAGNKDTARRYLDRALYMSSDHDVMAETWFWISQITDDPVEKRKALENCLSNDLQHARARRALAILDGKLKPDEIVDPDHLPPAPEGLRQSNSQRFMCPKCGGRMAFAPDGQSLVCEYCARSQTLHLLARRNERKGFYCCHGNAAWSRQAAERTGLSLPGMRRGVHPASRPTLHHLCILRFALRGQP